MMILSLFGELCVVNGIKFLLDTNIIGLTKGNEATLRLLQTCAVKITAATAKVYELELIALDRQLSKRMDDILDNRY